MHDSIPRIALAGMILESNAFSPPATEDDFRGYYYFEGDEILRESRAASSVVAREMSAFVRMMDATGPWQPVPLVLTGYHPWGPVEQDFFDRTLAAMTQRLQDAGPVDGVYLANHGAMVATRDCDPDGAIAERMRALVGPSCAIVLTQDLHANISDRLVEAIDVMVAYQTNPHVDMVERGEEAAVHMRSILAGHASPRTALVRLPLVPATVTLLTRQGPYADLIDYAQRRKRELAGDILNVSILGGFAFADTPKNGVAVVVSARDDADAANALANEIATRAWQERHRFRKTLTTLDAAVQAAVERGENPQSPASILSDAGDNPGGGGSGTTTELLAALHQAKARGVLYGSYFDPALVRDALEAGEGAELLAVFNRSTSNLPYSARLELPARVLAVNEQPFEGRLGLFAGRRIIAQPSCALEIGGPGGITVVVISARYQTADPAFFEHLGLDIATARTVCVKSRGHFRAGFEPWFEPEQVVEVDTGGLTSPVLERIDWKGLPRPVYPLDPETEWQPKAQ